jgi:hypothetical protein
MWYKRKNLAGGVMVISGEIVNLCTLDFSEDGCVQNTVGDRLDPVDFPVEELSYAMRDWENTSLWSEGRVW